MFDFPDNIQNFNMLGVLELQWDKVDKNAISRPYHALSYRICGNAQFNVNGKVFHIGTGDLLFIPKNLDYHLLANNETLYCVHFTCDGLPVDKPQCFTPESSIVFDKLFHSMYNVWSEKKPGYYAGAISYFFKILSKIQAGNAEYAASSIQSNMSNVLEYIHENFTNPTLSIKELADVASISESHFRNQFKLLNGISPLQYINDLRIKYACELIESNYYKMYEVAEKVGFNDTKYFSTAIKKATGFSPRELLKHNN